MASKGHPYIVKKITSPPVVYSPTVGLFGKRQTPAIDANAFAALSVRVGELESSVRRLEGELVDLHERYVKARRVASADARNQERAAAAAHEQLELAESRPAATPEHGWGARARRAARFNGGA